MNEQKNNFVFAPHVVCLIDILGQKEKLKGWANPPLSQEPDSEYLQAIRETVGKVLSFRSLFSNFFESFEQSGIPEEALKQASQVVSRASN